MQGSYRRGARREDRAIADTPVVGRTKARRVAMIAICRKMKKQRFSEYDERELETMICTYERSE